MPDARLSIARVDAHAVTANARAMKKHIPESTLLGAVVKADGYGHGATLAAHAALAGGADWLMVATVQEAVSLREAGITAPMLVLSPTSAAEAPQIVRYDVRVIVSSATSVDALAAAARLAHAPPPRVHVKVDTGLGRNGMEARDAIALIRAAGTRADVCVEGIATHFATADQPDDPFIHTQAAQFAAVLAALEREGIRPPIAHAANSGATLQRIAPWDMVRVGIALYGIAPDPATPLPFPLRPALSVESHIARLFVVPPGGSVGYGRTFVAAEPTRAALVPLGYADGVPRSASNRGGLLVRGRWCRLIGRVSMDQCVIAVPDDLDVCVGERVVVVGTSDGITQTLDDLAAAADTIAYELATRFGARLRREGVTGETHAAAREPDRKACQA